MIDEIILRGYWWLPDKDENKISGNIIKKNHKYFLNLEGVFLPEEEAYKLASISIIHGFSIDGKEVTLCGCYNIHLEGHYPGYSVSEYRIESIFKGVYIQNREERRFSTLIIKMDSLLKWFQTTGIDLNFSDGKDPTKPLVTITYSHPNIKEYKLRNGNTIIFRPTMSQKNGKYQIVSIIEDVQIECSFSKPKSIEEIDREILWPLSNLFTLFYGSFIFPHTIFLQQAAQDSVKEKRHPENSNIQYYLGIGEKEELISPVEETEMAILFPMVEHNFVPVLNNWFDNYEKNKRVYDLFFSVYQKPVLFLENIFLHLFWSLEAFHRISRDNIEIPPAEYEKIKDTIIRVVPGEYKEIIRPKIKYGFEKSQRRRLRELIDEFGARLIPVIEDKGDYINKIIETRNYLVHQDQSLRDIALKQNELYNATSILRLLIKIIIFSELQITKENIDTIIARDKRFQYLRNQMGKAKAAT